MNIRFTREDILQLLIFLINPFFSFLVSSFYLLKKKGNIIILALSLGLIFVYFPLMYDTSSNFFMVLVADYKNVSFEDIRLYNSLPTLMKQFDIQFMTIIYGYTFIILYIWFSIFNYFQKFTANKLNILFMIVFVFISIIYRNIMDLNRFYLAASLVLLILFLMLKAENQIKIPYVKILLLGILALSIHPSIFVMILVILLSINKINEKYYLFFPPLMLILSFANQQILEFSSSLSFLSTFEALEKVTAYISDSIWGTGTTLSGFYLVNRLIELSIISIIYFICYFLIKQDSAKITIKVTLLLMGIILFLLPYRTLFERYSIVFFIFSAFSIYKFILITHKKNILILLLFLFFIRFIILNFLWYGIVFTSGYNYILPNEEKKIDLYTRPFYYPTPLLLYITEFGYSDAYITQESTRGREYFDPWRQNPAVISE